MTALLTVPSGRVTPALFLGDWPFHIALAPLSPTVRDHGVGPAVTSLRCPSCSRPALASAHCRCSS